jgi:hypothetical protein
MAYQIKATHEPGGIPVVVRGRDAQTLRRLIDAGVAGISSLTVHAPRLSAYIFKLRKAGFSIETRHVAHGGPFPGNHALYRLLSVPHIIEDTTGEAI